MALALSLENVSTAVRSAAGVLDRQRGAAVNIIIQTGVDRGNRHRGIGPRRWGGRHGCCLPHGNDDRDDRDADSRPPHRSHPPAAQPHLAGHKSVDSALILPGAANTMNMQTTRVDVIALARGGTTHSVGYFASAYKLMETSLFLSDSLIRAAMPAMLYAKTPAEVGRICARCCATASSVLRPAGDRVDLRGRNLLAAALRRRIRPRRTHHDHRALPGPYSPLSA